MNKQQIIDHFIQVNGDLRTTAWKKLCNGQTTYILEWFDKIGITVKKPFRSRLLRRTLNCSFDEALKTIRSSPYTEIVPKKPGRKPGMSQEGINMVRVLDDPTCLFDPGSEFPECQVFGVGGDEWPECDEWPIGIRLECRGKIFVNTQEGFHKV